MALRRTGQLARLGKVTALLLWLTLIVAMTHATGGTGVATGGAIVAAR